MLLYSSGIGDKATPSLILVRSLDFKDDFMAIFSEKDKEDKEIYLCLVYGIDYMQVL